MRILRRAEIFLASRMGEMLIVDPVVDDPNPIRVDTTKPGYIWDHAMAYHRQRPRHSRQNMGCQSPSYRHLFQEPVKGLNHTGRTHGSGRDRRLRPGRPIVRMNHGGTFIMENFSQSQRKR